MELLLTEVKRLIQVQQETNDLLRDLISALAEDNEEEESPLGPSYLEEEPQPDDKEESYL
jgi:hypothetical protein